MIKVYHPDGRSFSFPDYAELFLTELDGKFAVALDHDFELHFFATPRVLIAKDEKIIYDPWSHYLRLSDEAKQALEVDQQWPSRVVDSLNLKYDHGPKNFNAHLDMCQQCRDHPFKLCPRGLMLLKEAAASPLDFAHVSSTQKECC